MASTYSQYKLELIGTGEQAGTWGVTTNANLGSASAGTYQGIEQAIGGKADVTMSSTTITLSLTNANTAQDARALYLNLTGSPGGAADLVVPAIQKGYLVKNGADAVVTVKVSGQTGVAVPVGKTMWLYNNGTDVTNAIDNLPSGATVGGVAIGTGTGTVTSVDVSGGTTGLTTSGGPVTSSGTITLAGTLAVANGGTGITSFGTGVATALGQNVTGSGGIALATSPTLVTPVLGTPTSGNLSNCTVDGTDAVGFRNTPVNSQSANYTLVLADSGKTIFHPASDANDRTFTIPAESSVNYAVGTVVTFINLSANDLTIAITTDTMYLAGDGATGSRTLAEYGVASAVKVANTTPVWVISGNGLT